MTPEFGATAAMFYIDDKTIDYLRLTGRDEEQIALVENYAKTAGLWSDSLKTAHYDRVLKFDLSSVGRNIAGRPYWLIKHQVLSLHSRLWQIGRVFQLRAYQTLD